MARCSNCYKPLPLPTRKGGRQQKFRNQACKQKFYRRHKRIARVVGAPLQPLFQMSFDMVKEVLDEAEADLAHERAARAARGRTGRHVRVAPGTLSPTIRARCWPTT